MPLPADEGEASVMAAATSREHSGSSVARARRAPLAKLLLVAYEVLRACGKWSQVFVSNRKGLQEA